MRSIHRWRACRLSLASAIVVVTSSPGAGAQSQPPAPSPMSNEMRSDYLFRTGEKKFDSGQYAEACADFAESLRLGPRLGTLLNLALCHETIGKPATAWREFHHAAAWAAQNNQKDRHDFAVQHALGLETKLPRVALQLPPGTAVDSVEVDGEPIPDARWYLPLYLDPGEHAIAVSAPGKQRGVVKFRVINSPTEQIVTVPALADEAPPPKREAPRPAPEPEGGGRRLGGYIALGVSAAGFAAGATFGVLAIEARNQASDHCVGNRCDAEGASRWRDAQSRATLSTIGFLAGAIAGGAGAWLLLTSAPRPSSPRVGVTARGDGATLGLGGAF
jgi:hypothetical protein